jgi:hypothetical protein
VAKGPLSDEEVTDIERARERPLGWGPTVYTDGATKADRTKTVIDIAALYWGARTMIYRVLDARAGAGGGVAQHPVYATAPTTRPFFDVRSTAPDGPTDGGSKC